jgi:hypothetical protein
MISNAINSFYQEKCSGERPIMNLVKISDFINYKKEKTFQFFGRSKISKTKRFQVPRFQKNQILT